MMVTVYQPQLLLTTIDMELLAGEGGADGEDMPDDFADAEEFAHLLESSGDTGMHHKQVCSWERRRLINAVGKRGQISFRQ